MADTYSYKTPGLQEYTQDIRNYMSYMKPARKKSEIEQGLLKAKSQEQKKKIVTRETFLSALNIIEEES